MLIKNLNHMDSDLKREPPKTLVILTGASRGIGKEIAIELATNAEKFEPIEFLITSTKTDDLITVSQELKQFSGVSYVSYNTFDISDLTTLRENAMTFLEMASEARYEKILFIINHGSLGPINFLSEVVDNYEEVIKAVNANVTGVIVLSGLVLKLFNERSDSLDIVNISSIAANDVFAGLGLYSIGKSARHMIMKIIDKEVEYSNTEKSQIIKTLNYSPGPVNTEMYKTLITRNPVESQRKAFEKLYLNDGLVPIKETCAKLVDILLKGKWSSNTYIDFFD